MSDEDDIEEPDDVDDEDVELDLLRMQRELGLSDKDVAYIMDDDPLSDPRWNQAR